MNDDLADLLTQDEIETLLTALMMARSERGFSEADAVRVPQWAKATRIAASALDLVLSGRVLIDFAAEGKPRFRPVSAGV